MPLNGLSIALSTVLPINLKHEENFINNPFFARYYSLCDCCFFRLILDLAVGFNISSRQAGSPSQSEN